MNIKSIIISDYLSSLKEDSELDVIFPLLLEAMGFSVLSKPKETKGYQQYGKDIIAVGIDEDGIKKRFYFELKGGEDRNINSHVFNKQDGIVESLREAKYVDYSFSNKRYENLPLKVVVVHNGELKSDVQQLFNEFLDKEIRQSGKVEAERWGLSELTELFDKFLFGPYLLTDEKQVQLFNKVIINLNAYENEVNSDFENLLDSILQKSIKCFTKYNRKNILVFQTIKLIGFIIYSESEFTYNNLLIAKKYLTCLVMKFWYWVLKNKLDIPNKYSKHINEIIGFYIFVISKYLEKLSKFSLVYGGFYYEKGGRYESIGYNIRTFDYIDYLITFSGDFTDSIKEYTKYITNVITANPVLYSPILDIQVNTIVLILNLYIKANDFVNAKFYLKEVLIYLQWIKCHFDYLPDANNDIENVIKLKVTGKKPIYYSDSTSPMLAILLEYTAILDMEEEYIIIRDLVIEQNIDLGLFIPYYSIKEDFLADKENDLEEQLFSKRFFNDGFQKTIILKNLDEKKLTFEEYKQFILVQKKEFVYEYRTKKAGYGFLIDIAHIYFRTPFFPDKWRCNID